MNDWSVKIVKSQRLVRGWMCDCFPYNLPVGVSPPYPGFDVLKSWLDKNCPNTTYEVKYKNVESLSAILEVIFEDEQEAMMFILRFS
jgi:hypothetical protein